MMPVAFKISSNLKNALHKPEVAEAIRMLLLPCPGTWHCNPAPWYSAMDLCMEHRVSSVESLPEAERQIRLNP
eukprot:3600744-Pleurochrysis_carterae.AAC.1